MTDGIPDTKLMFKYVEVGRFDKTDEELTSLSDKWMYVLKNLSRLDNRPAALREKIFTKLFEVASVAHFTPTELREYEDSLKAYRDIKDCLDTAKEEGREEGMEEGLAKGREEGLAISFPYSSYLEGREPYSSLKNLANCLGDIPTL